MAPCRHQSWAQENQISWDSLASGNLPEPQLGSYLRMQCGLADEQLWTPCRSGEGSSG